MVTGGGRGLGRMITEGLLCAGMRVYISSRKEAELDSTAVELAEFGTVHPVPADLGTVDGGLNAHR